MLLAVQLTDNGALDENAGEQVTGVQLGAVPVQMPVAPQVHCTGDPVYPVTHEYIAASPYVVAVKDAVALPIGLSGAKQSTLTQLGTALHKPVDWQVTCAWVVVLVCPLM